MQFKFDANQEFQVRAVEAVVNLLEGQQKITGAPAYLGFGDAQTSLLPPEHRNQFQFAEMFPGTVANVLTLTHADLFTNLSRVQQANGIEPDSGLAYIEETI